MKQPAEYYDKDYFEGTPAHHKSNYTKFGGYDINLRYRNHIPLALMILDTFHTPKGAKVLELGCAYGFLTKTLRHLGYDAYGMDISQFALSQADEDVKPFLMLGDISQAIPLHPTNTTWDLVTSVDVLEHVETADEAKQILDRIAATCTHQVHVVTTARSPHFDSDYSHGLKLYIEQWQALAPNERCILIESQW